VRSPYKKVRDEIMEAIEEIARVRAPPEAYLDALTEIQSEVDMWFDASIGAAKDDLRRLKEEG